MTRTPVHHRQPRRTAALLLVLTFCVTALVASGAFDSEPDLSNGSTAILTPEEAAAQPAPDDDGGNTALLGLLALLLLVGGVLLLQFALPNRRERRRFVRAHAVAGPAPQEVRRVMPSVDPHPTLVLAPIAPPVEEHQHCRCGAPISAPLVLVDPAAPPPASPAPPAPSPRRVGARIGHTASVRMSPVAPVSTHS